MTPTSRRPAKRGKRKIFLFACSCGATYKAVRMRACERSARLPHQPHIVSLVGPVE